MYSSFSDKRPVEEIQKSCIVNPRNWQQSQISQEENIFLSVVKIILKCAESWNMWLSHAMILTAAMLINKFLEFHLNWDIISYWHADRSATLVWSLEISYFVEDLKLVCCCLHESLDEMRLLKFFYNQMILLWTLLGKERIFLYPSSN